jgi:threonine dehydrogenase-like Zn-dependent dehydrogenase
VRSQESRKEVMTTSVIWPGQKGVKIESREVPSPLAATAPWTFDPAQLWRRGLTLFGSWVYELGEYEGKVRLAEKRAEALEKIVTCRFDGTRAEAALRAADKASEGKIVIDWTR